MTRRHGIIRRTLARLGVAGVAAATIVVTLPAASGADAPPVRQLRTLPQTGPLYVDSAARLLYQVQTDSNPRIIDIFNLDTFKHRASVSFDVPRAAIAPAFRGAGVHMHVAAVDSARGLLYYPHRDANANLVMAVIDGRRGRSHDYALHAPPPFAAASPTTGLTIEAIAYEPRGDLLYIEWMAPLPASGTTHSMSGRVFVEEVSASDGTSHWGRQLDGCNGLPTEVHVMPAFGRGRDALYAVCSAGYSLGQVGFGVLGGDATLVEKIPIDASGEPQATKVFLAPGSSERGFFDPRSERLMLVRPTVLAVFDGIHEVWVGLVPTDSRQISGDNSSIGRVYLCESQGYDSVAHENTGGLAITDAERAVQPPTAAEYASVGCSSEAATWPIVADAKTSRIFVPLDGGLWGVVRDSVPAYVAPPEFDSDAGTVDEPESAKTDTTFSAQAAAYGTRVVLVGGPLGVFDNSVSTVSQAIRQNSYQLGFTVGESSREVRLASISLAKLGKDGLEAQAIAADRDDRFEGDLQTVRNYELSGSNQFGQPFPPVPAPTPLPVGCDRERCTIKNTTGKPNWPYQPSTCVAFGGTTDQPQSDPEIHDSHASCDFKHLKLDVWAQAPKQTIAGLVTVGDSYASASVRRDPKLGVVSHVSSTAKNINIAGLVSIASATASVDSFATGHKHRASARSYHREFRGVQILAPDRKTVVFECDSPAKCDPASVISKINAVVGPRILARMPEPDQPLYGGTAKGTQSSLRQDSWQQLEEQVLYDKPSEDLTMAAFELQINGNLRASSGVIVQLAGVTGSSLYQIFRQPEILPPPPLPILPTPVAPTVTRTIAPQPGQTQQPMVVSKLVPDQFRRGTRFLIGLAGSPALVLAGWILLLAPVYVAVRRRFLMRGTGSP